MKRISAAVRRRRYMENLRRRAEVAEEKAREIAEASSGCGWLGCFVSRSCLLTHAASRFHPAPVSDPKSALL